MKRIRNRQSRIDVLRTEIRPRKRGRIGRYVYLGCLGAFAAFLFDLLAGELVYLRSEGMVTQDITIIGPEYSGSVISVEVEPGEIVNTGQMVATLRSPEMLEQIARLKAEVASSESKLSELQIREERADSLIPEAERRVASTVKYRAKIEKLERSGLVTIKQVALAEANAYQALGELKKLQAEIELAKAEYRKIQMATSVLEAELANAEAIYAGGALRAQEPGMVGTVLVSPGEGIRGGQRLIETFHGPPHVLAYVPVGALYDVSPGDEVVVRVGFHTLAGHVEALRPLAYRLPQEFQEQFRALERKQLIRVRLPEGKAPPLFTEVTLSWPGSLRANLADGVSYVVSLLQDPPQ